MLKGKPNADLPSEGSKGKGRKEKTAREKNRNPRTNLMRGLLYKEERVHNLNDPISTGNDRTK